MGDAGSARVSGTDGGPSRRGVLAEVLGLWLLTLLLIRGVKEVVEGAGLPDVLLVGVPLLFMYAPVVACRLRGVDPWAYPMHLPAFREPGPWREAAKLAGLAILLITPPWLVGYHLWQTAIFPWGVESLGLGPVPEWSWRGTWPRQLGLLVGYHLFFVAIPEEIFYRGYVQTRLNEVFPRRWTVLGTPIGWGLPLTCVVFAIGHSVVSPQWWHFAIFFPSLVFGWMRERTGGVVAGALFHAWANVQITTLDTLYGVIPVAPP